MARDEDHSSAGRIPSGGHHEGGRREPKAPANAAGDGARIDLNLATEEELARAAGIGTDRARRIVEYRERHGGFQCIEDLTNVSGFGGKMVDGLCSKLEVGRRGRQRPREEETGG